MYEHGSAELLPARQFVWRLAGHFTLVIGLVLLSLAGGMIGYRYLTPMSWVDAFLNASMLMGGMGPVNELSHDSAKIFAGCYALYAGLLFIVSISIMISPVVHRILHRLHADEND